MTKQFFCILYYIKVSFKRQFLSYKFRFISWVASNSVFFFFYLVLWDGIYTNKNNVYTISQLLTYIFCSKIIESISYTNIETNISKDLRKGAIETKIVRPLDYKITLLIENIGNNIASILIYIPVYALIFAFFCCVKSYQFEFAFGNCALGIISAIMAFFLNYFFSLCFSILIFKSIKSHAVIVFKKTILAFLSGSLIPYTFYPEIIQNILRVLPTRLFCYDSIQIFLGKYGIAESISIIVLQVVLGVCLYIFANLLWKKFEKNILVYGG